MGGPTVPRVSMGQCDRWHLHDYKGGGESFWDGLGVDHLLDHPLDRPPVRPLPDRPPPRTPHGAHPKLVLLQTRRQVRPRSSRHHLFNHVNAIYRTGPSIPGAPLAPQDRPRTPLTPPTPPTIPRSRTTPGLTHAPTSWPTYPSPQPPHSWIPWGCMGGYAQGPVLHGGKFGCMLTSFG